MLRRFSTLLSIGIRREDKNRWERRVPLVPEQIDRLVSEFGISVYVQPSTRRVIPDLKYEQAGATVTEDLSQADIIIGVKEVPIKQLIPNKTYLFFSHTHKGQPYNMNLLKEIIDRNIRLVDYELMTNENKKRLVLFSKFAGYAGMIDGMHGLGQRLLAMGYGTPFLSIGMTYMYRCLADARLDVTRTGQVIMDDGLPPQLGPMTFVFTGSAGNVTKGALHVFKCLPHEWVSPNDLASLFKSTSYSPHKVYGCLVNAEDYIQRKDGATFDKSYYKSHPQEHYSVFHEKIAPYTRMLVNGIFWDQRFPRFLTLEQANQLALQKRLPLLTLADISCDIRGPLEFMSHATSIDHPFFMYDPIKQENHLNTEGSGIQIMSIDNLPTEMPLEASEYFSSSLFPFIVQLAKGNDKHPVLKRAMITDFESGLEPQHKHLEQSIKKHSSSVKGATLEKPFKVLLLGSGFVAQPLVDYLLRFKKTTVTIASNSLEDAQRLSMGRPQAPAVEIDIQNSASLENLVKKHDLVVSFVPASMHLQVAKAAISQKKNMVTASYISSEMAALDEQAREAGITILNELGLDPGIDHMTAVKTFNEFKAQNKTLTSFVSFCGGLPAPEASNNPLGYKFSWSPKGVLLAALNSAKYLQNGQVVEISSSKLLESAKNAQVYKGFQLEGIPNRDSVKYHKIYNLSNETKTVFRGTLRYRGYCELMSAFRDLGLLSTETIKVQGKWIDLIEKLTNATGHEAIKQSLLKKLGNTRGQTCFEALEWLGCLSGLHVKQSDSLIDAFCATLQEKLKFEPGERDLVLMQHEFEYLENSKRRKLTSTLVAFGDPNGYTAMSKTVALPAAMGAQLLLEGKITKKGVVAPVEPEIYVPILKNLEKEGIIFNETVSDLVN